MTEKSEGDTPTGLTQDVGWQIGVQRTLPVDLEEAWALLVSEAGTKIWLGTKKPPGAERRARYKTKNGTVGEVRSFRVCDRIRLTWRPKDWDHDSTVQVALTPAANGTAIRFHQERLASEQERNAMREHWQGVLEALERHVAAEHEAR